MANNVVPFGKYKGQPVEAMAADRGYMDWLLAQPWFKDNYQNIYTLIINNFAEPSETPEHNALQVLFVNRLFAKKVLSVYHAGDVYEAVWGSHGKPWLSVSFEMKGADVYINCCHADFRVEIKPVVGDDYPAILRQIRNATCPGKPILFLENYIGLGATMEEFVQVFNMSGVNVVFRSAAEQQVELDWTMVKDLRERVEAADLEFRERWTTNTYTGWARDRLYRIDAGLSDALREQRELLEEALKSGDDEQIKIHGEAMIRGWQAANRRMEENEIEQAKAVFPGATVIGVREKKRD